jgi:hypothetical protein
VREVFEVEFDDIAEAHLHPSDMAGAIVSISAPEPPGSWRWGGDGWADRSVPGGLGGATVAVSDPEATADRWERILGAPPAAAGVEHVADPSDPGLTEIRLATGSARDPVEIAGVRFTLG